MKLQGSGMIRCPRCGTENPAGSTACASCERVLVSSGPVRMRPQFIGALAAWGLVFSAVGVFFYYYLGDPTREKAFFALWIRIVRTPTDLISDMTQHYEWKQYWAFMSMGFWTVFGGVAGAIAQLLKR